MFLLRLLLFKASTEHILSTSAFILSNRIPRLLAIICWPVVMYYLKSGHQAGQSDLETFSHYTYYPEILIDPQCDVSISFYRLKIMVSGGRGDVCFMPQM